jgi:hypothetical protein
MPRSLPSLFATKKAVDARAARKGTDFKAAWPRINYRERWSVLTRRPGTSVEGYSPSPHLNWLLPVTESSVTLPPGPRRSIMITFYRPPYPKYETIAMLPRITPGSSGFDIRTFACEHVRRRVVELVDPMKSLEAAGWLRGLHAPT